MVDGVWTGGWRPEVEIVEVTKPEPEDALIWVHYKYLNCSIPNQVWKFELRSFESMFIRARSAQDLNFKPSNTTAPEV